MKKTKLLLSLILLVVICCININLFANGYNNLEDDISEDKPTCSGSLCTEANGLKYTSSKTTCCGVSGKYRGRKSS